MEKDFFAVTKRLPWPHSVIVNDIEVELSLRIAGLLSLIESCGQ